MSKLGASRLWVTGIVALWQIIIQAKAKRKIVVLSLLVSADNKVKVNLEMICPCNVFFLLVYGKTFYLGKYPEFQREVQRFQANFNLTSLLRF